MKLALISWLLFNVLLTQAQPGKAAGRFEVYLLIGQSNMAGRGRLDAESRRENPRLLLLDSANQWVPATDPVHFDKLKAVAVGPAISFAQKMLEPDSRQAIGLIPCALGGSLIKVWQPSAGYLKKFHPYDDALARARLAMQQGTLKGILWHQGESLSDSPPAAQYLKNLVMLISRLRTDLQRPDLPFVAGEIGYFNKANYLNPILSQLPRQVSATAVVSAQGLTDKGDKLHVDPASARDWISAMRRP